MKVRGRPSAGHTEVVLRMQIVFLLVLSAITLFAVVRLTGQVSAPNEASGLCLFASEYLGCKFRFE